jgi:DNA-binding response OmpR family regulator
VTPEDKNFALSLGAVRFLEKPVDTEEFLLTIAEILTQTPPTVPQPMENQVFYQGYRERLESKLHHKNAQIVRTERLLQTLPQDQIASFQTLLQEERDHRDEIQAELNQLYHLIEQSKKDS